MSLPAEAVALPAVMADPEPAGPDVHPVPPLLVPRVWPHVLPLVERAIKRSAGDLLADDYLAALLRAVMQLWIVTEDGRQIGCFLSEIQVRPRRKVGYVTLLAGEDLDRWIGTAAEVFEDWARQVGCSAVEAGGREGLVRATKGIGWRRSYTVIRKEL